MASEKLMTQLEQEKIELIEQISVLRQSVAELSREKSLMLDELNGNLAGRSNKVIIEELLVEVEDDLAVAFDDYFAAENPFVEGIRKALYEE